MEDREALASSEGLLAEVTGWNRSQLYLKAPRPLSGDEVICFRELVQKRKTRIPLGYLLGKTYFWNEMLTVGPDCLIPRPETEILVERFIQECGFGKEADFRFLDLGTGSGAIGIALLRHFPRAQGTFSDLSAPALAITGENIGRYGLSGRAEIIQSNLFENLPGRRWDAILSNPPYLSGQDWPAVEPEVLKEPRIALDGGQDGRKFYRRIAAASAGYLTAGGWLVLEAGIYQAGKIADELRSNHFEDPKIFKDYSGIERVVIARVKNLNHG